MPLLLAAAFVFHTHACAPPLQKVAARCGTVATPDGIDLNVIVVKAQKKRAGATPMFHIEGGPGIAGTNPALFYAGPGSMYRADRDVVLLDQRGTGGSNALHCPALEKRSALLEMYPPDEVASCLHDLQADLTKYSTENAALDIDRVRQALGYKRIDIWAVSYGTRLAQVYMRRFPDRVRNVVLVGTPSLDNRTPLFHAAAGQRVLDLIFYKCQLDADCSAKYPALRSEWEKVVEPDSPFAEAFRSMLGTAAAQRRVPFLIHAAANGDRKPLLDALPKDSSAFALGLYLTIACSEGSARINPSDIPRYTAGTFLGDYRVKEEMSACAQWPKYEVPADFFAPVKSNARVLMISGEMDHAVPFEMSAAVCAAMSNCQMLTIPDMGHGPFDLDRWTHGECFDEIAARFLEGSLDTSCVKEMRPPAFQ
ncbi:MAG TPA: alpha/beta fold hydrolase [Thermoanaerobaculia bacterium]|nr:alpha/beta fold hydrolase [Thermoanaerobaculia bacterium]